MEPYCKVLPNNDNIGNSNCSGLQWNRSLCMKYADRRDAGSVWHTLVMAVTEWDYVMADGVQMCGQQWIWVWQEPVDLDMVVLSYGWRK